MDLHRVQREAGDRTLVQLNKSIERGNVAWAQRHPPGGLLGPAELNWKNNYTIDPEGRVYKCPGLRTPGLEVGRSPRKPRRRCAAARAPALGEVRRLPVPAGLRRRCLGGKYLKTGRRDEVACKKDMFGVQFPRERRPALPRGVPQ